MQFKKISALSLMTLGSQVFCGPYFEQRCKEIEKFIDTAELKCNTFEAFNENLQYLIRKISASSACLDTAQLTNVEASAIARLQSMEAYIKELSRSIAQVSDAVRDRDIALNLQRRLLAKLKENYPKLLAKLAENAPKIRERVEKVIATDRPTIEDFIELTEMLSELIKIASFIKSTSILLGSIKNLSGNATKHLESMTELKKRLNEKIEDEIKRAEEVIADRIRCNFHWISSFNFETMRNEIEAVLAKQNLTSEDFTKSIQALKKHKSFVLRNVLQYLYNPSEWSLYEMQKGLDPTIDSDLHLSKELTLQHCFSENSKHVNIIIDLENRLRAKLIDKGKHVNALITLERLIRNRQTTPLNAFYLNIYEVIHKITHAYDIKSEWVWHLFGAEELLSLAGSMPNLAETNQLVSQLARDNIRPNLPLYTILGQKILGGQIFRGEFGTAMLSVFNIAQEPAKEEQRLIIMLAEKALTGYERARLNQAREALLGIYARMCK